MLHILEVSEVYSLIKIKRTVEIAMSFCFGIFAIISMTINGFNISVLVCPSVSAAHQAGGLASSLGFALVGGLITGTSTIKSAKHCIHVFIFIQVEFILFRTKP